MYTHYFTLMRDPSAEEVAFVANGLNALMKYLENNPAPQTAGGYYGGNDIKLVHYVGNSLRPLKQFDEAFVEFNGDPKEELDHENFYLGTDSYSEAIGSRIGVPGYGFCKTARKPYDVYVCAALILLKKAMAESVEIKSDGELHEWAPIFYPLRAALEKEGIDGAFLSHNIRFENDQLTLN